MDKHSRKKVIRYSTKCTFFVIVQLIKFCSNNVSQTAAMLNCEQLKRQWAFDTHRYVSQLREKYHLYGSPGLACFFLN